MAHEVYTAKRLRGTWKLKKKAKESRTESLETFAGAVLQYVSKPDSQGSSKDSTSASKDMANLSRPCDTDT